MKELRKVSIKIIGFLFFLISWTTYSEQIKILEKYSEVIPLKINVNIENNESEPEFMNYIYIKSVEAPVRKSYVANSKEIVRLPFNTKLQAFEKIEYAGNTWYKVAVKNKEGKKEIGYISERLVNFRTFNFEEMISRIEKLDSFLKNENGRGKRLMSTNTYVPNPSNSNMDRTKDKYGVSADQNTKATYKNETLFIPDRSILSVESIEGNNAYVNVLSIPERPLKINKNVLSGYPKIEPEIKKVIVIDLHNENQGVFEKRDGRWELISYTLNKTGIESTLGFETPKGYFLVPMAKFEMGYRDEFNKAAGIAKYAIRFSGGGYIHGTPVNYEEEANRDFFVKLKESTLGTIEGTRKCIRNTEDHIKFLFEWVTDGKINRKSNEQKIPENVAVIVF